MIYTTGSYKSPFDIRTYTYKPTKATHSGGERYPIKYIDHQYKVGICTSISLTMNVHRATGTKYSPDFQYLLQKKYFDKNWKEGSSAYSSVKMAYEYGMLPSKYWRKTKISDRNRSYKSYIKKLQSISDKEIEELLKKCEFPVKGYAKLKGTKRDYLAMGINENESGLVVRYSLGNEWWTNPIEPLRSPKKYISGHLVNLTNFTGDSFRIANSWGKDWADKGTAYHLHKQYRPTEAWAVFYKDIPKEVNKKTIVKKVINIAELLKAIKILRKLGIIK